MAAANALKATITWKHADRELRKAIDDALAIRRGPSRATLLRLAKDAKDGRRPGEAAFYEKLAATSTQGDPRDGYKLKADGSPMSTQDRVRILRSLAVATIITVEDARWGGLPPVAEGDLALKLGAEPDPSGFTSPGHLYAASTLARTLQLFGDPGKHTVWNATTTAGEPAVIDRAGPEVTFGEETGFPPLAVAAIVLVAASAWTFAACYCGQAAAEVVDQKFTRDALTARMFQTQAAAIDLVTAHVQREREEHRAIPYSPQEQQVLDALLGTQRDIARETGTPLPNPFAGAVRGMEKAADKASTGIGIGLALAAVGGVYLATRGSASGDSATP